MRTSAEFRLHLSPPRYVHHVNLCFVPAVARDDFRLFGVARECHREVAPARALSQVLFCAPEAAP